MTATMHLVASVLRRDRWQVLWWVGGITALAGFSAAAILIEFAGQRERLEIVVVASTNPAFLFLRGTPDGISPGALFFFQAFTFLAVLAALMSTFLVVRNTRAEEDSARAELLASVPLHREAPLAAAVVTLMLANLLLAVAMSLVLIAVGLPATGSVLTALAVASVGVVFGAIAGLAAQAMPSSRAANGVAATLVGIAYVVRGVGDALGTASATLTAVQPEWISWLSPIGWGQRVSPFGEASAMPLLLHLATAAVCVLAALMIGRRRDLGSSLLQERPGPATASALRGTATGAAWVFQLPALIGWTAGTAVLAALAGVLAPTVSSALETNPSLAAVIENLLPGTRVDMVDVFTTAILGVCGILAAAAGIQAVLRLHAEEVDGRAELMLAGPFSRTRWLLGHAFIGASTIVVMMLIAGVAAGFAFVLMGEGWARVPSSVSATLAQIPAAFTLLAVAVLVFALMPRFAVALGWGALVASVIVGQLGDLLQLPDWVQNISPFRHTPAVPLEAFDPLPAAAMVAVTLAVLAVAVAAVERRDIPA